MAQIGFIGTGEIAESMVLGLVDKGHRIAVSVRNTERSAQLAEQYADVEVFDNQGVIDQSDIIILCLLSKIAQTELPALKFTSNQQVISVMVDADYQALAEWCAPVTHIGITIPLPFIATGGCPLPVFGDSSAVSDLFGNHNPILPVSSETALNAHFAATAMASVTFAQMQTAIEWLAGHIDDSAHAEQYMLALLGGYISDLPQDGQARVLAALAALSTEGGLNATLRAHMENSGMLIELTRGLQSFESRLGLDS